MNEVKLRLTVQGAEQVTADVNGVGRAVDGLSSRIGALAHAAIGLMSVRAGLQAVASASQELVQAQVRADRLNQVLAFSSVRPAAQEIQFLAQTSSTLGLSFASTSKAYASFAAAARGTALEGQQAQEVFTAVSKASAVMGLTASETEGALLALQQMISKGQVSAEELRGQLGERLPGAFQIAARAMGVTTQELGKMLEQGQLATEQFLPKFAKQMESEFGAAAEKAGQRLDATINRAGNAWEQLKQDMAKSGFGDFVGGQVNILSDAMADMSGSLAQARREGSGFVGQMAAAGGAALRFLNPVNAVSYSAQELGAQLQEAEGKLSDMRAELAANPGNILLPGYIKQVEALIERLREADVLRRGLDQSGAEGRRLGLGGDDGSNAETARFARQIVAAKAQGEVLTKYATDAQRLRTELDAVREKFGGVIPPELEQRIREKFLKPMSEVRQAIVNAGAAVEVQQWAMLVEQLRHQREAGRIGEVDTIRLIADAELAASRAEEERLAKSIAIAKTRPDNAAQVAELQGQLAVQRLKSQQIERKALNDLDLAGLGIAAKIAEERANGRRAEQKAIDEYWEALQREREAQAQTLKNLAQRAEELDDEAKASKIAAASGISLAEAIEQVTIARLREKQARFTEGSEPYIAVEKEIEARQRLVAQLGDQRVRQAAQRDAELTLSAWQGVTRDMGDALASDILRGGHRARDMLQRMFIEQPLSMVVQAALGSVLGVPGVGGFGGNSSGGLGGLLSAGSTAIGLSGLGAFAQTGLMSTLTGTSLGTTLGAAGGLISSGSVGGGLSMGAGALGPWVAGAAAAYALINSLDDSGTPHVGGYVRVDDKGRVTDNTAERGGIRNAETQQAVAQLASGLLGALNSASGAFGGGKFAGQFAFEADGRDSSWAIAQLLRDGQQVAGFGARDGFASDPKAGFAEFASEAGGAVVDALRGLDLPRWARDVLDSLGEQVDASTLTQAVAQIAQTETAIKTFAKQVEPLGGQFRGLSSDVVHSLAEMSGGLDALGANVAGYSRNFFSEAERQDMLRASLTSTLAEVGLSLPTTRDAFRALVDAQDKTTESGLRAWAALLSVQEGFAQLVPAVEAAAAVVARSAADILAERQDLEMQLLRLQGNTEEIRRRERELLDPSNRGLYDQIKAFEDQQAAADAAARAWDGAAGSAVSAAARAADAWGSVWESLAGEVRRLRGGSGVQALAALQREFAASTIAARGGDIEAAKRLPELSRQISEDALKTARTRTEADIAQSRLAASLETTLRATGATDQHLIGLRTDVQALRDDVVAALAQVASLTNRSTRVLEQFNVDGMPGVRV